MADVIIEHTCARCDRLGLGTKPWCPACPKAPDHRTHEQRILAMQEDSYKVLCDVRLHLQNIEHELRKPPVDMDDFVYSPRKPAAALKPGKRK